MLSVIKPKALKRGDAIGVVVPAGPVNRERMERALGRVQARGFRVKTYGDIFRSRGYLAGDDSTRADELMAGFADAETAAVWCARGGYGVSRILDRIDFDVIRRNPKVFVGFSDITALHIAIGQRTGLITFHGPNLQDGFGKPEDMPLSNELSLWVAIMGSEGGSVVPRRANNEVCESFPDILEPRSIHGGVATGRLTGGNLAVLCGLMGTPYEIQTAGRILFLEDISERLYRIDRYLSQLSLSGKLRSVAGVLLGSFSYDEGETAENESDIQALFQEYLGSLGVPVVAGYLAGHERHNLTLPMGAQLKLDADQGSVTLCEQTTE